MSILIGLIPALAWGLMPIVASKIGGKTSNQIFGTTLATFFLGILVFFYLNPEIATNTFILSLLSGACWAIGQIGQFYAYSKIGVSRTMPLSTGLQLIGTSLVGVFIFGEWSGLTAKLIGFAALFLVIIGIALTALKSEENKEDFNKTALIFLAATTLGYVAYSAIPKAVEASSAAIFFPQTIGMLLTANLYIIFTKQTQTYREKTSWQNILAGLFFSIGALTYIYSAQLNGIATGYILTQTSVVISTLGGIFILKEKKSQKQLIATIIGLVLIVTGSIITVFL